MLLLRETAREVGTELGCEQRDAVGAATLVANGIFHRHFGQSAAVVERHRQRVGNAAFFGVVVVAGEAAVFHAMDFGAQRVDARIGRHTVLVVGSGQVAKDQRHRHHVLDAVVTVGFVVQRPLLVDDADAGFVRADGDLLDVFDRLAGALESLVQRDGGFHCGLAMELRREADFEQHVFRYIAAVRTLEFEGLALEKHVIKAPGLGREGRRVAHLAGLGDQRQTDGAAGGIARRPALAAARVGGMAVSAQRLTVHPRQ